MLSKASAGPSPLLATLQQLQERLTTMANSLRWTAEAENLLKEIPFFVRPAARKKIEKFARERDLSEITETVYQDAKKQFG